MADCLSCNGSGTDIVNVEGGACGDIVPCDECGGSGKDHWAVTVERYGEPIVTLETGCLSGKPDLSDADVDAIRTAARNLLSFIGDKPDP